MCIVLLGNKSFLLQLWSLLMNQTEMVQLPLLVMSLPSTAGSERHYVIRSSLWPSVCCPSINADFARCNIYLLSGGILIKLAINIHHLSGNYCKTFQGQRSNNKITARPNALFQLRYTIDLQPSVNIYFA